MRRDPNQSHGGLVCSFGGHRSVAQVYASGCPGRLHRQIVKDNTRLINGVSIHGQALKPKINGIQRQYPHTG